jgi:hypothetical protein
MPAYLVQYMKTAAARKDGSLNLSEKSLFGVTVLAQLQKPEKGQFPSTPEGDYLELLLRYRLVEEHGCYLKEKSIELINKWIKRLYEDRFLNHIRVMRTIHGARTEEAIENWRNIYGITEEMRALDSDIKEFYRKR